MYKNLKNISYRKASLVGRFGGALLFLFTLLPTQAQRITIDAQIDSTVMWIGKQTYVSFTVNQMPDLHVAFPFFSDTIPGGLYIVGRVNIDSTLLQNGFLQVRHRYLTTFFEDSLLYIPSFPFVADGDTVWSRSLALRVVQPFIIDLESGAVADIKSVFGLPFYWWGIIRIILLVLLILAILAVAGYLIWRYVKKKPVFEFEKTEPKLPPHIEALNGLNKVKDEKMWQQGRLKEYYTELTDVVRVYIGRMFEINAMEMTSEEILDTLRYMRREKKEAYIKLQNMLQTSDLVKFAKWKPLSDESEQSLRDAFAFVEQTKPEEISPLNPPQGDFEEVQKKTKVQ